MSPDLGANIKVKPIICITWGIRRGKREAKEIRALDGMSDRATIHAKSAPNDVAKIDLIIA